LAAFQHNEVTDINDVVDGAEPDGRETLLEPSRTGTDLYSGYNVSEVKRAIIGRLDAYGGIFGNVGHDRRQVDEGVGELIAV
jgi:hypothetical protein